MEGLSCMVEMVLSRNGSSPKLRIKTSESSVIFVAHKWFRCEHLEGMYRVLAVAKRSHGSEMCALLFCVMLKHRHQIREGGAPVTGTRVCQQFFSAK